MITSRTIPPAHPPTVPTPTTANPAVPSKPIARTKLWSASAVIASPRSFRHVSRLHVSRRIRHHQKHHRLPTPHRPDRVRHVRAIMRRIPPPQLHLLAI